MERIIGVAYETAWSMAHRIRKAMANDVNELPLSGSIEVDAAIIKADGGQATQKPTYAGKDVLGITSRGSVLRLFVLDKLSKANIEHIVRKNIREVEAIYSDMCGKLRFLKNIASPLHSQSLAVIRQRRSPRQQLRECFLFVQTRTDGAFPSCVREMVAELLRCLCVQILA